MVFKREWLLLWARDTPHLGSMGKETLSEAESHSVPLLNSSSLLIGCPTTVQCNTSSDTTCDSQVTQPVTQNLLYWVTQPVTLLVFKLHNSKQSTDNGSDYQVTQDNRWQPSDTTNDSQVTHNPPVTTCDTYTDSIPCQYQLTSSGNIAHVEVRAWIK